MLQTALTAGLILLAALALLAIWASWSTNRIANRILDVLTFEPKAGWQIRQEAGLDIFTPIYVELARLVDEGWAEHVDGKQSGADVHQWVRKRPGSRKCPPLAERPVNAC